MRSILAELIRTNGHADSLRTYLSIRRHGIPLKRFTGTAGSLPTSLFVSTTCGKDRVSIAGFTPRLRFHPKKLLTFPGAGHNVFGSVGDRYLKLVEDFIREALKAPP